MDRRTPHDVLVEQVPLDVVEEGHRVADTGGEVVAATGAGLVEVVAEGGIVAAGGGDEADARCRR